MFIKILKFIFCDPTPFEIGDKVVCVNDNKQEFAKEPVVKDKVYTVKEIPFRSKNRKIWGVYLKEVSAGKNLQSTTESAYAHTRFKKLTK